VQSAEMMKRLNRRGLWVAVIWFVYTAVQAVGILKPSVFRFALWLAFGVYALLCWLVVDCTEVVLKRIDEALRRE
jgi:hypothetical protein